MKVLPLILSVASLALPGAARAQTANAGDVRCLLTMAALASNEQARTTAMNGVYYFLARVTQQEPNFDFSRSLRVEADKMSVADFRAEGARCGAILQSVVKNLQAAQAALQGFTPRN